MQLSVEQILEILKLIDTSECEEFRLETADLKLIVRKGGRAPAPSGVDSDAVAEREVQVEVAPRVTTPPVVPLELVPDGLVAVRAPMIGTFYRAPAPGAPPFVEVGIHVKDTDIVCILEVMKLMNSLPAGVRGRVARICAENATLVSQGQVLLLIEPEDATRA